MPPQRPTVLGTFLGKMTRYISLDRWKMKNAAKRGGGEVALALEELEECIPAESSVEQEVLREELLASINLFLKELPDTERKVFMCRYWYMESVGEIEKRFGFSQSKVTSMLHRTRAKLRKQLEKEGF